MATYFHRLSTNTNPVHSLCPPALNTYCKCRKAEVAGKLDALKHKHSVSEAVLEVIKPIFRDLAHPDLLKKCLHGKTQNVNGAFKNIVWTRIPKKSFCRHKSFKIKCV